MIVRGPKIEGHELFDKEAIILYSPHFPEILAYILHWCSLGVYSILTRFILRKQGLGRGLFSKRFRNSVWKAIVLSTLPSSD